MRRGWLTSKQKCFQFMLETRKNQEKCMTDHQRRFWPHPLPFRPPPDHPQRTSSARTSKVVPLSLAGVRGKHLSITSLWRPTASNICAPYTHTCDHTRSHVDLHASDTRMQATHVALLVLSYYFRVKYSNIESALRHLLRRAWNI